MRTKSPPQPLVFSFGDVSSLCAAVQALYRQSPRCPGRLCLCRGRYYLCVQAGFRARAGVRGAVCPPGRCLGAAPVLYAFCREHGLEISSNAVEELGRALQK